MAQEVRIFSVTVPASTPASAPQVTQMRFPTRTVEAIEFQVPPGPRGEVGFRIGSSGVQLIPYDLGTWLVTDDEVKEWELQNQHDSGSWEFTGYNTGTFAHTITIRFKLLPVGTVLATAAAPIPAGAISSPGGGFTPPPPTELPPPPALPPPALLPPPDLPPPPVLPAPGGPPGPAAAGPQPKLDFWSDAMGRLLTYPDQTNTTRFDEVMVLEDGSVGWYAFGGGAGDWSSYNHKAGSLGGNVVDVSACFTLYRGVVRLNIVGTARDGRRFIKVMNAQDYTVIQDWTEQPTLQSHEMALSKRVQAG